MSEKPGEELRRVRRRAGRSERERRREDLSVYEVVYIFWERKFLVLGAVMICVGAALFLTYSRSVSFTVDAVILIQPTREDMSRSEGEVFLEEASGRVASDQSLFEEAKARSGWNGSSSSFRDRLDPGYFVRDSGEMGLDVTFTSTSPGSASRAANAYAVLFVDRARQLDNLSGGNGVFDARVETPASALEASTSRRPVLFGVSAAILGLLIGGALALLLEGRTRSWRDARDAEMTLNAPVLGVIPDYEVLGLIVHSVEEDESGKPETVG